MAEEIHYQFGIPESLRDDAVQLYEEAFGPKIAVAIKNKEKRLCLLKDSLLLPFAVAAITNGQLVGLVGFHTAQGSLTKGITISKIFRHVGILGGVWATIILSLYERHPRTSELLMDGIAVSHKMRGHGIGTQLLDNLKRHAAENGYTSIRLDVIDINNNARRLYERLGFQPEHTRTFGYLRWLLGFGASTTMIFPVEQEAEYAA